MGGNVNKYITVSMEPQTSVVEEIVFNLFAGDECRSRAGCLSSANKYSATSG